MGLWESFQRRRQKGYTLKKLVDERFLDLKTTSEVSNHIVCDIDKTYLETEFETFSKLARIAFESANEKITVEGAEFVLHACRWSQALALNLDVTVDSVRENIRPHASLHFVSSSPPQLRSVLEEKLGRDNIDWESDTFKNQIYNLRKIRIDQLRSHIAYKTSAILKILTRAKKDDFFYLIGDNAESDPPIYLGIKAFAEGTFSHAEYVNYLTALGVGADEIMQISQDFKNIPRCFIKGIFIRLLPGKPVLDFHPFTSSISYFLNYFELALYFVRAGVIEKTYLEKISHVFRSRYFLSETLYKNYMAVFDNTKNAMEEFSFTNLDVCQKFLSQGIKNREGILLSAMQLAHSHLSNK